MTRTRAALLALALCACAGASAPAGASALTETATSGNVTATLSYDRAKFEQYANSHEKIDRAGATVLDQASPFSPICPECPPAPAFHEQTPSVRIAQLDATPDSEVIFDYYTGGAHCCYYSHAVAFNGSAYAGPTHDWGDAFYELRDLNGDGIPEFDSGDPAFAYAFGAFAAVQFPPQIWNFTNGVFVNNTRNFPAIIQADAKGLKKRLQKFKHRNTFKYVAKSILAAYAADQCLLGDCQSGLSFAAKTVKKAHLRRAGRFKGQLTKFLTKLGYVS